MVGLAASVTGIECATPLEAEVRELRLIAEHKPRYNRRSRFPEKAHCLKLTREPWPRLSLVRRVVDDGADYVGPFSSKRTAEKCLAALHETFPLRQCTQRLRPRCPRSRPACWPRWAAACPRATAASTPRRTPRWCASCATTCSRRPDDVVELITRRMARLADDERYEEAGVHRDRLAAFVRAVARTQRLTALTRIPQLVAARREDDPRGGSAGRSTSYATAGSPRPGSSRPGADAHHYVADLVASGETVRGGPGPAPAATAEETERILRWLEAPGLRLIEVDGEWTCPVGGATRHLALHDAVTQSRLDLVPFDDRRDLPVAARPVR